MPVNMDKVYAAKEEADKRAEGGSYDFKYLQLEEGPNTLRILPPFGNKDTCWVQCKMSYNVGPKNKVVVPLAQFGKPCPLQDEIDRLYKAGDEASKKEADAMAPKNRVFIWVIDRAHEELGPQLWNANQPIFRDILAIMADPDYGDITDPEKGTDLNVTYTPKEKTSNKFPDWKILARRNPSPLGNPAWIAEDLFVKFKVGQPSEEGYIIAALAGTAEEYVKENRERKGESAPAAQTQQAAPPPPAKVENGPGPQKLQCEYPCTDDTKFWVVDPTDETPKEMVATQIAAFLLAGHKADALQVMSHDQSSGWVTASTFGFELKSAAPPAPKAPPAPAAPPKAPPAPSAPKKEEPPFDSSAASSEEEALQKQLADLQRKKLESSKVSQDLKSALG